VSVWNRLVNYREVRRPQLCRKQLALIAASSGNMTTVIPVIATSGLLV
jgi:hypothetical protein